MSKKTRYRRLIAQHFPDIDYERTRLIERGWDNDVLLLDNHLAFRFPKTAEYATRFPAEVALLQRLQDRLPVAVPHYIHLPPDRSFGGYAIIPGRPLRRHILRGLPASARRQIARALGEFLSALHIVPPAVARDCGVIEPPHGYWWSKPHTKRIYRDMRERLYPGLNQTEIDWLDRHFDAYLRLDFSFTRVIVHGDLNDDHIFVDLKRGELSGIIDFADVEIADPALDFAGLWLFGRAFVETVMSHYEAHAIDDAFIERSKFPYRVHSAGNMLEILEGHTLPLSLEDCRKQFQREMRRFADD